MATAKEIITATAQSIAKPYTTIDAYAAELRQRGWWPKTKRGRGAQPATSMEAAKLLLAILAPGAKSLAVNDGDQLSKFDGAGFFLRTANMRISFIDEPNFQVVKHLFGVEATSKFLDVVHAVLIHIIEHGEKGAFGKNEFAEFDRRILKAFDVKFSVSGPYPQAKFACRLSANALTQVKAAGLLSDDHDGIIEVHFLHQFFGWHRDLLKSGEKPNPYPQLLSEITKRSERGLTSVIGFGWNELSSVARVLRGTGETPNLGNRE
jgi:hypothetical protein